MSPNKKGHRGKILAPLLLGTAWALGVPHDAVTHRSDLPLSARRTIFIMYSANAPREAPALFRHHFTSSDYARAESLPAGLRVSRSRRYVLVTSLRDIWWGEAGLRYWVEQGCGRGTPGTIVYDPERRDLTPPWEQDHFLSATRRAARLVRSTGCHDFGLAPGAHYLGLDAAGCTFEPPSSVLNEIPWRSVDVLDIQAQRMLSNHCAQEEGLNTYASAVSYIAFLARRHHPGIAVASQVSFRDNPPHRMLDAIGTVAGVIDGIYFSYPTRNPEFPCEYCSRANIRVLLAYLRGRA
jgi:hypothetical protein